MRKTPYTVMVERPHDGDVLSYPLYEDDTGEQYIGVYDYGNFLPILLPIRPYRDYYRIGRRDTLSATVVERDALTLWNENNA